MFTPTFRTAVSKLVIVTLLAPIFAVDTTFTIPISSAAQNQCSGPSALPSARLQTSARVGGVSLNLAATFLADMNEITGAYYDSQSDRIVFMGKKNVSVPQFNKDDLAVAIRAIFFKNTIPAVSIDFQDLNNTGGLPNMDVKYSGGIEDTQFGKTLFEADVALKRYFLGYDANQQPLVSTVPGYQSHVKRYLDMNPPLNGNSSRWWIMPKLVSLKLGEDSTFIFDQVKMQVLTEPTYNGNNPQWNQAATEFAQHQTDYYDLYAAETPSYYQTKQLAKIVAIVKWLKDQNIATDFEWARSYQPTFTPTPRLFPRLITPEISQHGYWWQFTGGISYGTPNSYGVDNGSATTLKSASEAVPASNTDIHWNFNSNGTTYDAVAVSGDAFRQLGGYTTSVTDMAFALPGDLPLAFTRTYSSLSMQNVGMGQGWDFYPAHFSDIKVGTFAPCSRSYIGFTGIFPFPLKIAFDTSDGQRETFTYSCISQTYVPDGSSMHSVVTRISPTLFTVKMKNNILYTFENDGRLLTMKDKNANTVFYDYDALKKLTTIRDNAQHTINVAHTPEGRVSRLTDWSGRTVQYGYTNGNLTSVTDPRGNIVQYAYDSSGRLQSMTNREGQKVLELSYTEEGKIATQKDAYGTTVAASYDVLNRSIGLQDSNGRTSKIRYDDRARVVEDTDALGGKVLYSYGSEFAPLSVTDAKQNTTIFTYDAAGNLLHTQAPDGSVISYTYDAANRITSMTDDRYKVLPTDTAKVKTFLYDSNGNIVQTNDAGLVTNFTYDTQGERLSVTDSLGFTSRFVRTAFGNVASLSNPLNETTTYTYDAIGRLLKTTDPLGKYSSATYDANSNILQETNGVSTVVTTYDKENRPVILQDALGTKTYVSYNAAGNITKIVDAKGNATQYTYDGYGNLVVRTNAAGFSYQQQFDQLNRLQKAVTPLGKTSFASYDAVGNRTQTTDAMGQSTSQAYDVLNRPLQTSYSDQTNITRIFDARNNIRQVQSDAGVSTAEYDVFDRLREAKDVYGTTVRYSYDYAHRLQSLMYPDGKQIQYGYTNNGQVSSVTDFAGNVTSYTYASNGLLSEKSMPCGVKQANTYDAANRVIRTQYKDTFGTVKAQFDYIRNANGAITSVTETGPWFTEAVSPIEEFPIKSSSSSSATSSSVSSSTSSSLSSSAASSSSSSASSVASSTSSATSSSSSQNSAPSTTVTFTPLVTASHEGVNTNYATAHTATNGTALTGMQFGQQWHSFTSRFFVWRAGILFDTSSLPDDATITDVQLRLVPNTKTDKTGLKPVASVVSLTPTSTAMLQASDFSKYGLTKFASLSYDAVTLNQYNNFVLNTAGQQAISKTSTTALGLRIDPEIAQQAPPTSGNNFYTFAIRGKESPTEQPLLQVTYQRITASSSSASSTSSSVSSSASSSSSSFSRSLSSSIASSTISVHSSVSSSASSSAPSTTVTFTPLVTASHEGVNTNYATAHTATNGTALTGMQFGQQWHSFTSRFFVWRAGILFDTSSLPDDATITDVQLRLVPNTKTDKTGLKPVASVVSLTPTSTAMLQASDFSKYGLTKFASLSYDAVTLNQYNNFVLNTAGQQAISKTSTTALGLRIDPEIAQQAPPTSGNNFYTFAIRGKESPTEQPLLQVTYQRITASSSSASSTSSSVSSSSSSTSTTSSSSVSSSSSSSAPSTFVTNYLYDALGQITKATYSNGTTFEYSYDNIGNRTLQKVVAASTVLTPYTYDNDARLTLAGTTNYSYNNNGELLTQQSTAGTSNYRFNAKQQLASINTNVTYTYDGFGHRIGKKVNGVEVRFTNDTLTGLSRVLAEANVATNRSNFFVYGPTELLSIHAQPNPIVCTGTTSCPTPPVKIYYPIADALGNVRFVLNDAGAVVARYSYDPFGTMLKQEGSAPGTFQFSTEQTDPESGMTFLRARYYDPSTGRFITRDPLVGPLTLPHSQNPYAYAVSDPVNMSDPSGQAVPVLIPLLYYGGMACAALAPVAIGLIANTPLLDIAASQVEQGDYLGAVGTATMGMSVGMSMVGAGVPASSYVIPAGATNLSQQLALEQAMTNPVGGTVIIESLKNPAYPSAAGWVKKASTSGPEVHWFYNKITGVAEGFKLK